MRELLRFYLFHKDSTARRSRNSAAASLVFFVIAGYGFTALLLGAWIFRSFEPMWLSLLILFLALGTTAHGRSRLHAALRSNNTPHTDARASVLHCSCLSARAGGRGR